MPGHAETAADPSGRIIYNKVTGALFYDSNGNAAGGSVVFSVHQFGTRRIMALPNAGELES